MVNFFLTYVSLIVFIFVYIRGYIRIRDFSCNCYLGCKDKVSRELYKIILSLAVFLCIFSLIFVPVNITSFYLYITNFVVFLLMSLYMCNKSEVSNVFINCYLSLIGSCFTVVIISAFIFYIIAVSV